jgi:hypothetical protein
LSLDGFQVTKIFVLVAPVFANLVGVEGGRVSRRTFSFAMLEGEAVAETVVPVRADACDPAATTRTTTTARAAVSQ